MHIAADANNLAAECWDSGSNSAMVRISMRLTTREEQQLCVRLTQILRVRMPKLWLNCISTGSSLPADCCNISGWGRRIGALSGGTL